MQAWSFGVQRYRLSQRLVDSCGHPQDYCPDPSPQRRSRRGAGQCHRPIFPFDPKSQMVHFRRVEPHAAVRGEGEVHANCGQFLSWRMVNSRRSSTMDMMNEFVYESCRIVHYIESIASDTPRLYEYLGVCDNLHGRKLRRSLAGALNVARQSRNAAWRRFEVKLDDRSFKSIKFAARMSRP